MHHYLSFQENLLRSFDEHDHFILCLFQLGGGWPLCSPGPYALPALCDSLGAFLEPLISSAIACLQSAQRGGSVAERQRGPTESDCSVFMCFTSWYFLILRNKELISSLMALRRSIVHPGGKIIWFLGCDLEFRNLRILSHRSFSSSLKMPFFISHSILVLYVLIGAGLPKVLQTCDTEDSRIRNSCSVAIVKIG